MTTQPLIETSVVAELTDDVCEAFERLLPQLSSSATMPSRDELSEVITSPSNHLIVGRTTDGRIVCAMTLVVFRIPTGVRAWIEDVVVDTEARGLGVGVAINEHALSVASELGARTVDLTSRPSREAANNLYKKIGFVQRETNVYRFTHE